MWQTPGFTAAAIATLALGLGLTSAVMSLAVSPRDPLAIVAGPAVLIAAAALAIPLPACHAMKQDPIIALRAE